jgi:hypothetical protein
MNRRLLPAITMVSFLIGAVDFCTLYAQDKSPTHAPVVVRGGSVEFRSTNPWTVTPNGSSASTTVSSTATLAAVSIDGVTTSAGSTSVVAESAGSGTALANNWSFTLIFRDANGADPAGGDNSKRKIQICSDQGCTAANALSGNTLYLVGDGTGIFTTDEGSLDGQYLLRYDLNAGGGCSAGKHTKCNHLKKVTVAGIPRWDDTTTTTTFWCFAGQCDVGIGQ